MSTQLGIHWENLNKITETENSITFHHSSGMEDTHTLNRKEALKWALQKAIAQAQENEIFTHGMNKLPLPEGFGNCFKGEVTLPSFKGLNWNHVHTLTKVGPFVKIFCINRSIFSFFGKDAEEALVWEKTCNNMPRASEKRDPEKTFLGLSWESISTFSDNGEFLLCKSRNGLCHSFSGPRRKEALLWVETWMEKEKREEPLFLLNSGLMFKINQMILHPVGVELTLEDGKTQILNTKNPVGLIFEEQDLLKGEELFQSFIENVSLKKRIEKFGYTIQSSKNPPERVGKKE